MKARDWLFLCEHIKDVSTLDLIRSYIPDGKSRKSQKKKFHKELPNVPNTLTQGWNDCCIFILIFYDGSSTIKVIRDNIILDTPKGIQRMIKVCLNKGDVKYHLYQTNADSVRCNDIIDGIRTYSVAK